MKRFWMLLLCLCALLCLCLCACAEEDAWGEESERVIEPSPLVASVPAGRASVEVRATRINGETWLFLPAFADVERITLQMDGEALAWSALEASDGIWQGEAAGENASVAVSIMRSENLRALFLFSDDPVNQGREYLDSAADHETYTSASMALVDTQGHVDHAGAIRKIRGRGNFTWFLDKKAYQFRLEDRADLLDTGDRAEMEHTWILLADGFDGTMLHNRITMDLARELGMTSTGGCEHVDLYYDGEYRGLYLLTEKVEAGEGRLEVDEYDTLIEKWNRTVGQYDLEALPVAMGENRYGNEFAYIDGVVEAGSPDVGTFVLEMENETNTLSDRCWLRLSDGSVLACESPENATESMMRYISERIDEARNTLKGGGINPDTGRTLEDDFNVEAFARQILITELSYNADTYRYSSTWFILPAGETRFEPGPIWDFDIAYRTFRTASNGNGLGVKDETGWLPEFYSIPAFMHAVQKVYQEELSPALHNILLGDQYGRYLKPLDAYVEEIAASRRMNDMLWDWVEYDLYLYADTVEGEYEMLRQFLTQRDAWLYDAVMNARDDADRIDLWGYADYLRVEADLMVKACPWNHVAIQDCHWERIAEATESEYAVWQLEVVIAPQEGYAFHEPEVKFNGKPISCEKQEDGCIRIRVAFEDPSYRPVDYWGDDIGMIYNPEVYAQNYPEIAAEYEGDPEGLMDYFCDEGMMEDQMGNAFFKPSEILYYNAELMGVLGTDWMLYYWDFIDFGYEEGWLIKGGRGFVLDVIDAL